MSSNTRQPRQVLDLHAYLKQRHKEYKTLYKVWLDGTDAFRDAPWTWPADRCLLTTQLPLELLLLVCELLYQADLFHLALTCRALYAITLPLLYKRDIADFDCLGVRWACTFGIAPTLERCFYYGASANHVFDPHSHAKCSWVLGAASPWASFCRGPLQTAIVASEPEIVRLLLAHGADVHAPDPETAVLERKLNHEGFYPINFAMGTPAMAAFPTFQHGHTAIVRHLLQAGADPNQYIKRYRPFFAAHGRHTFTPLVMAMQPAVPVETVRLLLEHGADTTRLSSFGGPSHPASGSYIGQFWDRSPLGVALGCLGPRGLSVQDFEKIRLLLAHGGAHELVGFQSDPGSRYPMPLLYRHWDHPQVVDVVKLLVAERADIASWAKMAIPPTFSVIWWAEEHVCRFRPWKTEQDIAAIGKACEVITLIAEAAAVEDSARAVRKPTLVDAMVSADLEEICPRSKDQTALRYLCTSSGFKGAADLIFVLLRNGADMHSTDPQGRTALHHAASFGSGDRMAELFRFLGGPASSGLDVDVLDARGWTPLHYACLFGFWGQNIDQVTRAVLLLSNGADIRARTNTGWTPLSLAVLCANHNLVSFLLDHGADVRDLFVFCERDSEPTMAPIGRILFPQRATPGALHWLAPQLASELAASRKLVSGILEDWLGIQGTLPPKLEAARVLQRSTGREWRSALADAPVMPRLLYSDVWSRGIEQDIDRILTVLDNLGYDAWIAPLSDGGRRTVKWRGYPAYPPDDV